MFEKDVNLINRVSSFIVLPNRLRQIILIDRLNLPSTKQFDRIPK